MKILKFWAPYCGPCKTYGPVFDDWAESADIETESINVDEDTDAATKYEVRSIPYTILVDADGKKLKGMPGILNKKSLDEMVKG